MSLSFTRKTDNTYFRLSLYSILCTMCFFLLASAEPNVEAARVTQHPLLINFPQVGVAAAARLPRYVDISSASDSKANKKNQAELISKQSEREGVDVFDLQVRFHNVELDIPIVTRSEGSGWTSSLPSLPFFGPSRASISRTSNNETQRFSRVTADILRKQFRHGKGMMFAKLVSENIFPIPEYVQFEIQLSWLTLFFRYSSLQKIEKYVEVVGKAVRFIDPYKFFTRNLIEKFYEQANKATCYQFGVKVVVVRFL